MVDMPIDPEFGRSIAPIVDAIDPSPMMPPDEEPLPTDEPVIVENADGSADIIDPETPSSESSDFGENLAEKLISEHDLSRIAIDLLDCIDRDKEARSKRDEQYADGIKRTGLGKDAPGGADFEGASRAVHPILAEGCIDYSARAMKELFPASGPCKTKIIGDSTDAKIKKAERKKDYLNWLCTTKIRELRAEKEQLLTQLPLGGSQYAKIWWDIELKRPRYEFVPIDNLYLPFEVSDFYTAHRITQKMELTRNVFDGRVESGFYRETPLAYATPEDESKAEKATDKIEGREDIGWNEDSTRTVYECQVDLLINDDPLSENIAPYVITIDASSRNVLAIYRNWGEDDELRRKLHWLVEWKFIPWRGAYGIGLPHLIGSLSAALTGALRALLDSAHINNAATMLKLKGSRESGQNVQIEITQVAEIEGPTGIDDIRKLAMPMPFNPPSPVLFQLLDWITNQARAVVGTAEEKIADASNNMPVGTALALIEQGSQIYSAIHARGHASQAMELEIIHRLCADNLADQDTIKELGDLVVYREDFEGPMDIVPVSDPNIFSEAQRYAQLQAVLQLADKFPQLYDAAKLNRRALSLLNFPDSEEVLLAPPEAEKLDAITENVQVALKAQPLKVYDDQDDYAHAEIHLHFMLSPIYGASPLLGPMVMNPLLKHVMEHLVFFYQKHANAAAGAMTQVTQLLGQTMSEEESASKGAAFADQGIAMQLSKLMPMIQQAMQLAQQFTPPPPMDPAIQAQLVSQEKIAEADRQLQSNVLLAEQKRKDQELQLKGQVAQQDAMQEGKDSENALQAEYSRAQLSANTDIQVSQQDANTDLTKSREANQTALIIAEMKNQLTLSLQQQAEIRAALDKLLTFNTQPGEPNERPENSAA